MIKRCKGCGSKFEDRKIYIGSDNEFDLTNNLLWLQQIAQLKKQKRQKIDGSRIKNR